MSNLGHIIYISNKTEKFDDIELSTFLDSIREKNKNQDITGMLLFCDDRFLQVIECDLDTLNQLFVKLKHDQRHDKIVKLIEELIDERVFNSWSMGYSKATREEIDSIDGMNDFFRSGKCMLDIDAGRAQSILKAYASGRYRGG